MKRLLIFSIWCLLLMSCSKDDGLIIEEKELTIKLNILPKTIYHNREFKHQIKVDTTAGDTIVIAVQHPSWLQFNDSTNTLTGTPGWDHLNSSFVTKITVSNSIDTLVQLSSINILLGEIVCESDFGDPAESAYILPYNVDESYRMWQSYCHPEWSHRNWFSYDFDMPMGTEILASRAGVVIFERDNFDDGTRKSGEENFIFIEHEDGTVVHYVHLMKNGSLVKVGQQVSQGEVIGLSGDSGGSAGPHLHTTQFIGKVNGNYNFDRQYSIPMNYSNAEGPLNSRNGLIIEKYYKALTYGEKL